MNKKTGLIVGILIIGAVYIFWAVQKPLPPLKAVNASTVLQFSTPPASLTWPAAGQSALGIEGSKILETNGTQTALPTASVAKIITALTVLNDKPLALNQPGPAITLGANDVTLYQSYAAQEGSVVPVTTGEQISEYQILQAMLLPSANNMADSLAIWAFGSLPAYKAAATNYVKQLDLKDTTIGSDASGFAPSTTSTAQDLVRLGEAAMKNPVLASIVNQSAVSGIPVVNNIKNVNFLLGSDGIVGIKTGNSDQDAGAFLGAARTIVNQKPVTVITATIGSPSLFQAMKDSKTLILSADANFKPVNILNAGSIVGDYRSPDGSDLTVATAQDLNMNVWSGQTLSTDLNLPPIPSDSAQGKIISSLNIVDPITGNKKSVPLRLTATAPKPSIWYRISHP